MNAALGIVGFIAFMTLGIANLLPALSVSSMASVQFGRGLRCLPRLFSVLCYQSLSVLFLVL